METICQNAVFGTMTYKHSWTKPGRLLLFGKEWPVTVQAAAFRGEQITSEQQASFQKFMDNKTALLKVAEQQLEKYVRDNLEEIQELVRNANTDKMADILTPKTVLFQRDGTAVLLLDCAWDEENGIAAEVLPDSTIGAQELFL